MSSSDSLPILIKANRDGVTLVPDPEASFESMVAYLGKRLSESGEFFRQSGMVLDLRGRSLRTDEILTLHRLLVEKAGGKLTEVKLGENLIFTLDQGNSRPVVLPKAPPPREGEDAPVIVRSTCRSGARIVSPSDCVILGDVNPGAEVIAIGDIIIFGNLRGVAHAGAGGSRSARIWALSIEPSQLRIADLVAVLPRGGKPNLKRFEIAEIRDDAIGVTTL